MSDGIDFLLDGHDNDNTAIICFQNIALLVINGMENWIFIRI